MTPPDPRRPDKDSVNLADESDVRLWTQSLGISRDDLERAVAAVGTATGDVYDYVNRSTRQRF